MLRGVFILRRFPLILPDFIGRLRLPRGILDDDVLVGIKRIPYAPLSLPQQPLNLPQRPDPRIHVRRDAYPNLHPEHQRPRKKGSERGKEAAEAAAYVCEFDERGGEGEGGVEGLPGHFGWG